MTGGDTATGPVRRWLPVLLRVLAVVLTSYPAVRKFVEYAARVDAFETYGMPWPELAVPVTGVIELVAIVLVGLGIAGRLGAGALAVGMVVAIVAAGANPANVLVLVASASILVLGTGPHRPAGAAQRNRARSRLDTGF